MRILTQRLEIAEWSMEMAPDVQKASLDEDTRRFVPDEVFETLEEAQETITFLMNAQHTPEGPFVYPVLLEGRCIGYVQACRTQTGVEVGYHIAAEHTGKGYATEAVTAFLPVIMNERHLSCVDGIVMEENAASIRVLEKCGFGLLFQGEGLYQGQKQSIRHYRYPR